MKLFVTGGAGYIGSHFCQLASKAGHSVVVYDNLSTGHRRFAKFGPLIVGDLRDTDTLIGALNSCSFDFVVHFAGKALVRESTEAPDIYYDNNTFGTLSLLRAMKCSRVKKILFSSSCATYGTHSKPIKETDTQRPINPYGFSKKQCEEMIFDFCKSFGFQAGVLRYFNVIGQSDDNSLYEDHNPEPHILPNILLAEIEKRPLTLFGSSQPTPDGTCVRDYIDVRDLAQVHLDALEQINESQLFISNVGRGIGTSLLELISAYEKVFETKIEKQFQDAHPGDPASLVASSDFFKSWYNKQLFTIEESIHSLKYRRNSQLNRY